MAVLLVQWWCCLACARWLPAYLRPRPRGQAVRGALLPARAVAAATTVYLKLEVAS